MTLAIGNFRFQNVTVTAAPAAAQPAQPFQQATDVTVAPAQQ